MQKTPATHVRNLNVSKTIELTNAEGHPTKRVTINTEGVNVTDFAKKESKEIPWTTIGESSIENVTATVEVGGETKTATVTKDGANVNIDFPDLQGQQGERGNGITSIEQTVINQNPDGWNVVNIKTTDNQQGVNIAIKNGSKGKDGAPGQSIAPQEGMVPVSHTLGYDSGMVMSQKGITEAIDGVRIVGWKTKTYKYIDNLILNDASSVGDTGTYGTTSSTQNYKLIYMPVSEGDIIKVTTEIKGPFSAAISSVLPAVGVSATRMYWKNYVDSADNSVDEVFEMPSDGYFAVVAKIEQNTDIPEFWIANKSNAAITQSEEKLMVKTPIVLPEDEYKFQVTTLNIFSSTESGNARGKLVHIVPEKTYLVETSIFATVAIMKSGTVALGAVDFSDEYTSRILVKDGKSFVFKAPSDAHYVYLLTKNNNNLETRVAISEVEYVNDLITKNGIIPLNIDEINKERLSIVKNSTTWSQPGDPSAGGKVMPVVSGGTYAVYTKVNTYMAILKNGTRRHGGTINFADDYPSRISIYPGFTKVVIPSDAHAMYIYTNSTSGDNGVQVFEIVDAAYGAMATNRNKNEGIEASKRIAEMIGNPLTPLSYQLDENGEEIPTTKEVLYIQKKSKQITNLKWTPLGIVPKNIGSENFTAYEEVTGMPYSSTKEISKYIGYDVSIYTFMTAVNNPYSLLYTENIREDRKQSAWGREYHGINCGPYFGLVCSVLTGICTGQSHYWNSDEDEWCANRKLNIIKIYNQSAQSLKIGDITWRTGHNRLILGLKRNANGDVTHVLVSEAGARVAQQNDWITAEQFDSQLASESGIIYRNMELYKNTYTPSDFVLVDDEVPGQITYNDDICTFAGDKAAFREGELVVLNYNLKGDENGWQSIEVYKDNVLFDTYILEDINQTGLPESQRYHALKLEGLEAGKYKARLIGAQTSSEWTEWEVIQTDVTITKMDGILTVKWQSGNGVPDNWVVCDIAGSRYATDEMTEEQKAAGSVEIDLEKYVREQHHEYIETDVYLKIHFKGEFGRVTNEPILIE